MAYEKYHDDAITKKIESVDCPQELKSAYEYGISKGFVYGLQQAHEDTLPDLPHDEKQYRKGFSHGFEVGKTNKATRAEIEEWVYSKRMVGAPGTPLHGKTMALLFKPLE